MKGSGEMIGGKTALFEVTKQKLPSNLLKDRFLVPPFSVFDTRQGYWQDRKRQWQGLGIKSELGRGDNLLYQMPCFNYEDSKAEREDQKAKASIAEFDGYRNQNKVSTGKCLPESIGEAYGRKVQATSIFDPVLCEIVYRWFSISGAKVLDPFAGGSVRGILAACLGRDYTGIDLSDTQVEANKQQFDELCDRYTNVEGKINWINGDSLNCKELAPGEYDLIFTCPPYYDLEVYSDKPGDISNCGTYEEFMEIFRQIIKNACDMLNDNSFAVCVVGDVRNHKKDGAYYNFVGDTTRAFMDAGLCYYNDAVLVNVTGTLPVRASKQFNSGRKLGKQHQNVLIFYKGNTSAIKEKFGEFLVDEI